MKPQFSQRDAETAIRAIARRIYRRHAITESTSLQDAVAIAAARGDHVAAALSDDRRLIAIAAGFGWGSARNSANQDTLETLQLLSAMDGLAEKKFQPQPLPDLCAESDYEVWLKTRGKRGPSRQKRLADAERKAEAQGMLSSSAVFLIGRDEGPVRVGVSKQPVQQLRLANRYCLVTSRLGYEGFATSNAKTQRIERAVIDYAKARGLRHPTKADVLMVPMTTAIALVGRMAAQLDITLLSKEEKASAVADFECAERAREDLAFGFGDGD